MGRVESNFEDKVGLLFNFKTFTKYLSIMGIHECTGTYHPIKTLMYRCPGVVANLEPWKGGRAVKFHLKFQCCSKFGTYSTLIIMWESTQPIRKGIDSKIFPMRE